MNSPPPEPKAKEARRKLLWAAFWFMFISTPAGLMAIPILFKHFPQLDFLTDYGLIECGSTLIGGSIIAALLLARLHSQTRGQFIRRTLGFSFAFALLFGLLSYAGCSILTFN